MAKLFQREVIIITPTTSAWLFTFILWIGLDKSMKNALIIGGLSIALVVGGGVVYTFMSAQKDPAIITKKTADPTPVIKPSPAAKADCKAAAAVVPLVNLTTGMGMTTAIAECE